ncbi:MAG: helix-turn-helix domain-containing protein, partial [Chloroflexota bacterium]|nr:helix-turn-helix domain-containing protein [Chloroflexota bacterium]
TVVETLQLEQGQTPDEIATARELTIGTIYNHLAELIKRGSIAVEQVVDDEERVMIEEAVREVGTFFLSPIKARLPEEISYGEIRCVVAAMEHEGQEPEAIEPPAEERELVEQLMAWRREEARRLNQPPYFIFSNAALHAIAAAAPRDLETLEVVRGVGPHKLEEYGETILAIIGEVLGDSSHNGSNG